MFLSFLIYFFLLKFLKVILWTNLAIFHKSELTLLKQFFSKLEFLFFVLVSMVSRNMRHKLKNAKNLPELTWSWQNKPQCRDYRDFGTWVSRWNGGETFSHFVHSYINRLIIGKPSSQIKWTLLTFDSGWWMILLEKLPTFRTWVVYLFALKRNKILAIPSRFIKLVCILYVTADCDK